MKTAPFNCEEGDKQGSVESMPLFTFIIDDTNNLTNGDLRIRRGVLVSGANDAYLLGPPYAVSPLIEHHKERVSLSGLNLNVNKTKCYIHVQKYSI